MSIMYCIALHCIIYRAIIIARHNVTWHNITSYNKIWCNIKWCNITWCKIMGCNKTWCNTESGTGQFYVLTKMGFLMIVILDNKASMTFKHNKDQSHPWAWLHQQKLFSVSLSHSIRQLLWLFNPSYTSQMKTSL